MGKKYNAVVGQSGGPTCAINATLAGVISGCEKGVKDGSLGKIYGMRNGIEGLINESFIELQGKFDKKEDLEILCMTPASALGSCRFKLSKEEHFKRVFEVLEKYEIKYFFYIGGNDSMDAVAKLEKYKKDNKDVNPTDTHFIGVPKTIDNDLCITDHTPGFGSAAKYIATSLAEVTRDCEVYLTKAVTIIEIMGRDAGWLTASSALTKEICGYGADLIYLPEVAFDEEKFLDTIRKLLSSDDKNSVIVCVSEGIRDKDGEYVAKSAMSGATDSFGHIANLSGTGKYLENLVRNKIGCKCRSVELNVLQRCASHIASKTDISESFEIGKAAPQTAFSGKSGRMMIFERSNDEKYSVSVKDIDVNSAANLVKSVPPEFIDKTGTGITQEGIAYLMPLIMGECEQKYKNGLPVHYLF